MDASDTAAMIMGQPVLTQLMQLGIVDVKLTNNQDEVGMMNNQEKRVVVEEGTSVETSTDDIENFLAWWKEQAHVNGTVPTATLDDGMIQ